MKKNIKKYIFITSFLLFPFFAWASTTPFDYTPLEKIPGAESSTSRVTDFYTYIQAVYKFGIWAVGIAALLMISIGAFMYITSAGNNASMEKAKGVIMDALIGLILALTAYLLLFVINPDLVKISQLPQGTTSPTSGTTAPPTTQQPPSGTCNGTNAACCKSGTKCTDCSGCAAFSNGYSRLCYKDAPGNTAGCQLNSSLATKINNANLGSVHAEVSEAWPPTVNHSAACHTNGTCADVRCKNGCSVANALPIYNALKGAGLSVLFETTPGNCQQYINAGITNCSSPSTMTAPSFHVY